MADWLFEPGIGEERAILVEHGEIVEALLDLPTPLRAGTVVEARLGHILIPGRRGIASTEYGDAMVEPLPGVFTEGAAFRIEIVREAIPEPGRVKLARARAIDADPRPGPGLAERVGRVIRPVRAEDAFEKAGWSELIDQAMRGEIPFAGGSLRMSLTPAMTLFDVDGNLPPAELAKAGAAAAARSIRRLGITGSIGIDLPTLSDRAERQAAASRVDTILPQPFERTAVNGFGFLQIVRRRVRPSIPEIVQADPAAAWARGLMRRAQRAEGHGAITIVAAPAVTDRIAARPEWLERIEREAGAKVDLQADESLSISSGHVHRSLS